MVVRRYMDPTSHKHLPSEPELRVKALETLLTRKGLIDPLAVDEIIEFYEHKIGPRHGARVVAKAWSNPQYCARLLENATQTVAELGYTGRQGEHVVAVENTPEVHNLVVCTLCSCFPWPLLGIPPAWYKSDDYRSRAVREPQKVLSEFGVELLPAQRVRVQDSTAEIRYLVIPMRPAGTEGWAEEKLASIVTRDSMVGTGLPKAQA